MSDGARPLFRSGFGPGLGLEVWVVRVWVPHAAATTAPHQLAQRAQVKTAMSSCMMQAARLDTAAAGDRRRAGRAEATAAAAKAQLATLKANVLLAADTDWSGQALQSAGRDITATSEPYESDRSIRRARQDFKDWLTTYTNGDSAKMAQILEMTTPWMKAVGQGDGDDAPLWAVDNLTAAFRSVHHRSEGRRSHGDTAFLMSMGVGFVWNGVPRGGKSELEVAVGGSRAFWKAAILAAASFKSGESRFAYELDSAARRVYPAKLAAFVVEQILANSRPSPYECLQDPDHWGDKERAHATHWIDLTYSELLFNINVAGEKQFGNEWKLTRKKMMELMPFYIRKAKWENCVCRYHLEFKYFAAAVFHWDQTRERPSDCTCDLTADEKALRRLFCPCNADQALVGSACLSRECSECKGPAGGKWRELSNLLCPTCVALATAGKLPPIRLQKWTTLEKAKQTGNTTDVDPEYAQKEAKVVSTDFKWGVLEMGELADFVTDLIPRYLVHHVGSRQQEEDGRVLEIAQEPNKIVIKLDFAENLTLQKKNQLQSTYFDPTQVTIHGVACYVNVNALNDIESEEKERLLKEFKAADHPPIICEYVTQISDDLVHDVAFVQHAVGAVLDHYAKTAPEVKTFIFRSDGCRAQYKNRKILYLIARKWDREGIHIEWTFHVSCHGKNMCDSQGGKDKRDVRSAEAKLTAQGEPVHDINNGRDVFEYLTKVKYQPDQAGWVKTKVEVGEKKMAKSTCKLGNKGGVYRQRYEYFPAAGDNAVPSRRHVKDVSVATKDNGEGVVTAHHGFSSTADGPTTLDVRRWTCHACRHHERCCVPVPAECGNELVPGMDRITLKPVGAGGSQLSDAAHKVQMEKEGKVMARNVTADAPDDSNPVLVAFEVVGDPAQSWCLGIVTGALMMERCKDCIRTGATTFCQQAQRNVVDTDPYMGKIWCGDNMLTVERLSVTTDDRTAATLR